MNLKPIAGTQNRVFVKRAVKGEKKTKSGLFIVEKQEGEDKLPNYGVVIAVSDKDNTGAKPFVKKGDTVYFFDFTGKEAEHELERFLVLKESDIYGIVIR